MLRHRRDSVGARAHKYVLADLQASPKEIANLAKKRPLDAIAHPNCPPDVWWELAQYHTLEALQSAAGVLYILENPSAWADMEILWSDAWVDRYSRQLDRSDLRLFCADCVEHVLPLYRPNTEQSFCHWSSFWQTPEKIIEAARLQAGGKLDTSTWSRLEEEARTACNSVRSMPAWYVIHAAFYLITTPPNSEEISYGSSGKYPWEVWMEAARAVGYSVSPSGEGPEWWHSFRNESIWQWRHLLTYLLPR